MSSKVRRWRDAISMQCWGPSFLLASSDGPGPWLYFACCFPLSLRRHRRQCSLRTATRSPQSRSSLSRTKLDRGPWTFPQRLMAATGSGCGMLWGRGVPSERPRPIGECVFDSIATCLDCRCQRLERDLAPGRLWSILRSRF